MYAEKISISVPQKVMEFIEEYKISHQCKSRSQVIEEALALLRERDLELAYRDCRDAEKSNPTAIANECNATNSDGLAHETW